MQRSAALTDRCLQAECDHERTGALVFRGSSVVARCVGLKFQCFWLGLFVGLWRGLVRVSISSSEPFPNCYLLESSTVGVRCAGCGGKSDLHSVDGGM